MIYDKENSDSISWSYDGNCVDVSIMYALEHPNTKVARVGIEGDGFTKWHVVAITKRKGVFEVINFLERDIDLYSCSGDIKDVFISFGRNFAIRMARHYKLNPKKFRYQISTDYKLEKIRRLKGRRLPQDLILSVLFSENYK